MPVLQEHNNGQFTLTIPKKLVELEGLKKGDRFKIVKVQGYLALEPIR